MTTDQTQPAAVDDEDDDFTYLPEPDPAASAPQVSSYIAIIRIISVLGIGLCLSFGLFISLVGVTGLIVGVPIMLLAVPCYFGMQFAEKLATRERRQAEIPE